MMARWTRCLAALLLAVMLCMTVGCGKKDSHTEEIIERGTLRILISPEYPPYCYWDADGNLVGADVELAKQLAALVSAEPEFVVKNFADLEQALIDGEGDIILSAYPVTETLQCTSLYVDEALYVLTAADNEDILTEQNLEGKIIGVQKDTQGDIYVTDMVSAKNVERYTYASEAAQALAEGKLEAIITDGLTAGYLLEQYPDRFRRVYIGENMQQFCAVLPEGSDLYAEVDSMISTVKSGGKVKDWVLEHTIAPAEPQDQTTENE